MLHRQCFEHCVFYLKRKSRHESCAHPSLGHSVKPSSCVAKAGARMSAEAGNGPRGLWTHLPARVRLAVARVPADPLAKGRHEAVARDWLVLSEALGDGHAEGLVRVALDAALADGHDARLDHLAHVDLERGALEAGRRRRRLQARVGSKRGFSDMSAWLYSMMLQTRFAHLHGVVEVRRLRARRRRRRLRGIFLGVACG